jgi:hypothetical protein
VISRRRRDWGLGVEVRCRALVSQGQAADDLYREAIERLGRTRLRPEMARAHLLYGEWLRSEDRRSGAAAAARIVLPDILRYDRSQPAAYPNGRSLTDDAFSARFAWLTNGKITTTGLKPHDDLLAEFPYLGLPNLYPAG